MASLAALTIRVDRDYWALIAYRMVLKSIVDECPYSQAAEMAKAVLDLFPDPDD